MNQIWILWLLSYIWRPKWVNCVQIVQGKWKTRIHFPLFLIEILARIPRCGKKYMPTTISAATAAKWITTKGGHWKRRWNKGIKILKQGKMANNWIMSGWWCQQRQRRGGGDREIMRDGEWRYVARRRIFALICYSVLGIVINVRCLFSQNLFKPCNSKTSLGWCFW